MADISHYKQLIEVASRGEDVRDAIIGALEALNEESVWTADDVPTQGYLDSEGWKYKKTGKLVTEDVE